MRAELDVAMTQCVADTFEVTVQFYVFALGPLRNGVVQATPALVRSGKRHVGNLFLEASSFNLP